jgi:hypothetical protein
MKRASHKTYVSGRKLEQYQQERGRQISLQVEQQQKKDSVLAVGQLSLIQEMPDEEGTLKEIDSLILKSGALEADGDMKMAAVEEQKESVKKKIVAAEESDEDENASAEDLDSDELEDEIQDNVGELL